MEKMFIPIVFLFSVFIPDYAHIAVTQRQEVFLSTTSCSITSLTMDDVGSCDNNGTADPFDDFFTADILVEFIDPPATGQLRVELGEDAMEGGGVLSVDVADLVGQTSHTFEDIRIKADGDPTEIPVSFSAEPFCREVISNGPAVSNCSGSLPCEITNVVIDNVSVCNNAGTGDPSDDFFTARVSVSFFNPPASGDLRIEPGGDVLPGGGATSVPVGSMSSEFGHSFTGVRFKADGTTTVVEVEFTANNACVRTATGSAVNSCSAPLACDISSVIFSNTGPCDNNGTSDPADDFFTADLTVNFTNPPATGNLLIEPGGDALPGGGATSVPMGSLVGNSHTFTGVRFKADGTVTVAEVEFSANTACIRTGTGPTVQPCSDPPCTITVNFLGTTSPCDNNDTPNDPSDDFFTKDVQGVFFNRPLTGNLQIVPGGDVIGIYSVPVGEIIGNSHIFNDVKLKADGTPTVIQMNFTDDPACIDEGTGPAVEGDCCDLVITNVVATPESCPNASDGSITVTATTSAGPLTYAISGPVNQSNNTGVFSGLPDGNYAITVTDDGAAGNCSETSSAFVASGLDQTPPTPVCRNTTVTLDATGNYTLTTDDVLDLGASSDNCGTVNFVGKSPGAVSCVQVGQTVPVNVTVNDGNGNTATCTAQITVQEGTALPAGFSGDNVGNANGTSIFQPCSGQKFTLTASGFSTSSTDVLRLASRQLCGNGEIIAHVANISGGGWAGVTLRETTAPGSKKVGLKTQFSSNIRREIRTTTNGGAHILNFLRPQDTWFRLVRSGSNFSGFTSVNGVNWNFAFSATVSMSGCIRAGLFSESINGNTVTTAVFDQVTVTGATAPLVAPETGTVASFEMPDFQAYPNPTTGEVTLNLNAFTDRKVRVEISNLHGQTLKVLELNSVYNSTERLDLSQFGEGMYLIAVKSEAWPVVVKRIVLMEK